MPSAKAARSANLTVAVTGPTGEIGQAVVAALERSREVGPDTRHGAPPVRPRKAAAGRRSPTGAATCSTPRRSPIWSKDADVVVHLAFIIMGGAEETRAVNLAGSRNVFEATVAAGVDAARLRLLGGRLRLPSRQPPAAHRGRPRARHRRATTTRPRRPRSRRCWRHARRLCRPRPTCSVPASSAGRDAPLLIDSLPYTQISERLPGSRSAPARRRAAAQAGAARPGGALPARAPRRRRRRDARGGARPRRARHLQPRGAGPAHRQAARRGARLALDPGARAWPSTRSPSWSGASASCPHRHSGSPPSASP